MIARLVADSDDLVVPAVVRPLVSERVLPNALLSYAFTQLEAVSRLPRRMSRAVFDTLKRAHLVSPTSPRCPRREARTALAV